MIGLRAIIKPSDDPTQNLIEQEQQIMKFKFYSYVIYQLVSIYIANYFKQKLDGLEDEERFKEENYASLFQFKYDTSDKTYVYEGMVK